MPRLARAFIAVAVLMWGTVAVSFWVQISWHFLLIAGPGGGASLVLAGVTCMLDRMREREKDADEDVKDALVYALADLTLRRGTRVTRPLRQIV